MSYAAQAEKINDTADRAARYGASVSGADMTAEALQVRHESTRQVQLSNPDLVRIVRLRLLGDPGFPYWDVSYCYGFMRDGEPVRVDIGVGQLNRSRSNSIARQLVQLAMDAGKHAKRMGLLDSVSTLS
jgi:hypothetical protein